MARKSDQATSGLQMRTCTHTEAWELPSGEGTGWRWCTTCGALELREPRGGAGRTWREPTRAAMLRTAVEVVRDVVALVSTTARAVLDAATSEEVERSACSIWRGEERERDVRRDGEACARCGHDRDQHAKHAGACAFFPFGSCGCSSFVARTTIARVHRHHVEAVRCRGKCSTRDCPHPCIRPNLHEGRCTCGACVERSWVGSCGAALVLGRSCDLPSGHAGACGTLTAPDVEEESRGLPPSRRPGSSDDPPVG